MKKTTRLTALLLALVLLLGTLSASATETAGGISLYNLTGEMYAELLAEAVGVGLTANQPCGTNNPYCASVTLMSKMATAQERYDYLVRQSGTAAQNVLMHYYEKHTAEETLCLCAYPAFDAEYVPGGINHDAACPWHFANLTVNEQYHILMKLNATAQTEYKSTLNEDQLAKLEKFSREIEYYSPCDPDSCPIAEKYYKDFFAMDTFYLYEYLDGLREEDGDPSDKALEIIQHLRNQHILDDTFCQCEQFTFVNSDHKFGRSHHTGYAIGDMYIDCPWRFDMLTTEEQAQVITELKKENKDTAYAYALLSDKQKAELDAFLAGVGKAEETITTNKDSEEGATEPEVQVKISVPTGVFGEGVTHVMEAGEALMTTDKVEALDEAAVGHTLAAFDISFYNLDRPGEKLQPVNSTVPLTFTVDVSNVEGDWMQVYHLIENADGSITAEAVGEQIAVDKSSGMQTITINADSFSTYALQAICNGSAVACFYEEISGLNGFEIHALMADHIDPSKPESAYTAYERIVKHYKEFHATEDRIVPFCVCADYETNYANKGYGSITHDATCAWHLAELTPADQYTVISGLADTEKQAYLDVLAAFGKLDAYNAYVDSLNPEQPEIPLADYYEQYLQAADKEAFLSTLTEEVREMLSRVDVSDYTATATESAVSVKIDIPEGVFGEGVTHVVEAGEVEMTDEQASALKAAVVGHTLASFDISFYDLNNPATELQPVNGQTVPLTFTVDVSGVEGNALQVYHLYEENGQYVAEAVGEPIALDKTMSVQKISVDATAFSIYVVAADCDGVACGYNDYIKLDGFARHAAVAEYVGVLMEGKDYTEYYYLTSHYNSHLGMEDPYPYCTCATYESDYANMGYGSIKHVETYGVMCTWHFSQLEPKDQYTVYQGMSEADRVAALASIEGTEKYDQLMALINPPEIVEPEIKADTTSVELSFAADATGHQWYQSTDGGITWTAVVGAESATLTLDLSQSADALGYIYKCTATQNGEQVESQLMGLADAEFRSWILNTGDAITVTMAMLNRAMEVQAALDGRTGEEWNFSALEALRLEETVLYSVYTGQPIADLNTETGALVDRSMGLIVGYVDTTNGTIVAPPVDETTGGDDAANN